VPKVEIAFANPIARTYALSVGYRGNTFSTACPMTRPGIDLTPGINSCDDKGFAVWNVDLGHEANQMVALTVAVDNAVSLVTADLAGIANSRDCTVVCYEHRGTLGN